MSTLPCSRHGAKVKGKLASFYWAWFDADGVRHAYKERVCMECTREQLMILLAASKRNPDELDMCPACGADSSDDQDPMFLTLYAPNLDPQEFHMPTCAPCAAKLRIAILPGASKLEDRGVSVGGPRPPTPDPWLEVLG